MLTYFIIMKSDMRPFYGTVYYTLAIRLLHPLALTHPSHSSSPLILDRFENIQASKFSIFSLGYAPL